MGSLRSRGGAKCGVIVRRARKQIEPTGYDTCQSQAAQQKMLIQDVPFVCIFKGFQSQVSAKPNINSPKDYFSYNLHLKTKPTGSMTIQLKLSCDPILSLLKLARLKLATLLPVFPFPGSLILLAGFVFARRSVSRVLLHRGGQEVTLTTYYPLGLTSSFTVPLRQVSCMSHRSEVPAMIPLKVKGRPFYFLLDKEGRITNAQLFDITVGAYRNL